MFLGFLQEDVDVAVQLLLKLKVEYKQMTGQEYKAGCPPPENVVAPDNGPAVAAGDNDDGDSVDPWNVSTTNAKGVDYDKLIGKIKIYTTQVVQAHKSWLEQILCLSLVRFGSSKVDQELLNRMEKVAGQKLHHFLRRGIFFSHRSAFVVNVQLIIWCFDC